MAFAGQMRADSGSARRQNSGGGTSGREQVADPTQIPATPFSAGYASSPNRITDHETNTAPTASRFIWDTRFALALLDLLFIAVAQWTFLDAADGRLDFLVSAANGFIFAACLTANLIFIYASGGYARDALLNRQFTASRLPVALGLAGAMLFVILHYGLAITYPKDPLYRSVIRSAIISLITVGISLGATLFARIVFYGMVRRGIFRRRVLVVGTGRRAHDLYETLNHHGHRAASELIFVSGSIVGGESENLFGAEPAMVTPTHAPLEKVARDLSVDEIVVALDDQRGIALEHLLACKSCGIRVTDVQNLVERETGRVDLGSLESSWLFCSDSFGLGHINLGIKRIIDILFSLILLFIALPTLVIAMVAIGIEGHGRIFFKQKRVTRNGRTFWLYKLRTMFADAEKSGPRWAEANDPRITPVGRILRKFRIDEIPQLLNVLRGDMSLVGPRPERPVFVEQLSRELPLYNLRHTVNAGLTGWAQINYRYGASTDDARRKLEYDLHYVKNYHFLLDISIIVQTFRVLIWGDGAR